MHRRILYIGMLVFLGVFTFPSPAFSAEPQSEQAKQVMAVVGKAAALTERKGKEAFAEFKKKGSEWYKGDIYIFVLDMNGTVLMHPVTPELEGKTQMDMKDASGKAFVKEMVELLKTKDAGWVDYMWPKPGADKPSKKSSYVRKAKMGGQLVMVGAGIYTE